MSAEHSTDTHSSPDVSSALRLQARPESVLLLRDLSDVNSKLLIEIVGAHGLLSLWFWCLSTSCRLSTYSETQCSLSPSQNVPSVT